MLNNVAKLWVEALRSGKYKQCKGQLKREDQHETQYCCLGVLCKLAQDAGIIPGVPDQLRLPNLVTQWAGLSNGCALYTNDNNGRAAGLTKDNDELGKNFPEIADIIESEPKGLFK